MSNMMKAMTLAQVTEAVAGTWYGEDEQKNITISSVVIDSRKVLEGTLFVAIPGEKVDGHDFIPQVLQNGAVCAISEKVLEAVDGPYILVDDTKKALRDLAQYYRSLLDVTIVGITGSVGKTSTKEMIATVLSEKYSVQKTAGNFNNEIGLPLTIFSIGTEHEVGVVEMGISDFGEMSRLACIARPDIMVITNIGQCHLENLGTRDGILKAKTECFDYLNEDACVVLNGMDDKLATISSVNGKAPCFFGTSTDGVMAYADEIESLGLTGSRCLLHLGKDGQTKDIRITVPVAGEHMVINAAAAAMVGELLDMTPDEIAAGISHAQAVAGRGRQIQTDKYILVDDCYNANPVSMRAELDLLKVSPGRRVAILGDMFELGEEEARLHYDLGAYAIECCDLLICIGDLSRNTADGAFERMNHHEGTVVKTLYYATKELFLAEKDVVLWAGDTILLKASHGMEFTVLLDALMN